MISTLLAFGANINACSFDGYNVLHHCVSIGQFEAVHLLLNYECNIELTDPKGWTALHYAAKFDHAEIAMLLLRRGLDPCIKKILGAVPHFTRQLTSASKE
jgi:ankyrin repeat protein